MNKLIMFIGNYLILNYGKATALAIMFAANKALLFSLIFFFITTLLSLLTVTYNTVQNIIGKIKGLSDGSTLGNASECLGVITSSFLDILGFFDAFDVVGPTLFLVYFTYFNVVLLSIGIKIYRFIDKAVTEFALIVK